MADYYRRRIPADLQGIVSTAMDGLSGSPSGTSAEGGVSGAQVTTYRMILFLQIDIV